MRARKDATRGSGTSWATRTGNCIKVRTVFHRGYLLDRQQLERADYIQAFGSAKPSYGLVVGSELGRIRKLPNSLQTSLRGGRPTV